MCSSEEIPLFGKVVDDALRHGVVATLMYSLCIPIVMFFEGVVTGLLVGVASIGVMCLYDIDSIYTNLGDSCPIYAPRVPEPQGRLPTNLFLGCWYEMITGNTTYC